MIDSIKVEKGKYEIVLQDNYSVDVYRGDELWVHNPPMSKMFIALIYEVIELRKLVCDVSYDFNPDNGELGPKCGPEMLQQIKDYEDNYGKLDPTK